MHVRRMEFSDRIQSLGEYDSDPVLCLYLEHELGGLLSRDN